MGSDPPPPPFKLVALVIAGALGLGLLAVGVVTTWGWTLFVPGFVVLIGSLVGAWIIQRSRDRTVR